MDDKNRKMLLVCFVLIFLIAGALLITLSVMDFIENPKMQSLNEPKFGVALTAAICGGLTILAALCTCSLCTKTK